MYVSPGLSLMGDDYKLWDRVKNDRFGNTKIASSLAVALENAGDNLGEQLIVGATPHEIACITRHAAALKMSLFERGIRFVG